MMWTQIRQHRLLAMTIVILSICLIQGLLWFLGARQAEMQSAELQWIQSNRNRGLDTSIEAAVANRIEHQAALVELTAALPPAGTQLEAETGLLERISLLARETGVLIQSSQVLAGKAFENVSVLSVDIRGRGSPQAVVVFLNDLIHGSPKHTVPHIRLDSIPGSGELSLTMTVSTMAIIDPDLSDTVHPVLAQSSAGVDPPLITLFGPEVAAQRDQAGEGLGPELPPFAWQLVGIVHGSPQSAALFISQSGRTERFVRIGDVLDGARITDITSAHVTVQQGGEEWRLSLAP